MDDDRDRVARKRFVEAQASAAAPSAAGGKGHGPTPGRGEPSLPLVARQIPAVVWTTDRNLRLTAAFGTGLETLPRDMTGYLGKSLYEWFGTSDPGFPPIAAHLRALDGQSARYERRVGDRDFDVYVEPLRNPRRQVVGCLALAVDVTGHREADEQLRQSAARAGQLEALVALSTAVRRVETRAALLPLLARRTAEILRADAAGLLLLDRGALTLAAGWGPLRDLVGWQCPPGAALFWQALRTGQAVFVPDVADNPAGTTDAGLGTLPGLVAYGLLPLRSDEDHVGLLVVAYTARHAFSGEERTLAAAIAEVAAGSLRRAAITNTLEQRVADRTRHLAVLYDVTAIASQSLDMPVVLDRALARVLAAMRSPAGAIHLLDDSGETLHLAAQCGLTPEVVSAVARIPCRCSPPEEAALLCNALGGPAIGRGGPLVGHEPGPSEGVYHGLPMQAGGRTLGVLSVVGGTGQPFSAEEIALLATVADHLGVAVDAARLRERAGAAALLRERERLARELHDSVAQSLYSLTLFAEAARQWLGSGQVDRGIYYLDRIGETAHQALGEMRLLVYELRPVTVEREGLLAALQRRLAAVEVRVGVEAQVVVEGELDLPVAMSRELYWIAHEALNNAIKHAHATAVTVYVRTDAQSAELEVVDDGQGFDPDRSAARGGLGLVGMRERAERLGGVLVVTSELGKGTRVKVTVSRG